MSQVAAAPRRGPRAGVLVWPALTVLLSFAGALLVARIAWELVALPDLTADLETEPISALLELTGTVFVALLITLVVIAAITVVLWTIGIVWGARRLFPAGRRLVPATATVGTGLLGSLVALVLVDAASAAVGGLGEGWYLGAVGLAVAASCAVFPWWDVRVAARRV